MTFRPLSCTDDDPLIMAQSCRIKIIQHLVEERSSRKRLLTDYCCAPFWNSSLAFWCHFPKVWKVSIFMIIGIIGHDHDHQHYVCQTLGPQNDWKHFKEFRNHCGKYDYWKYVNLGNRELYRADGPTKIPMIRRISNNEMGIWYSN